MGSNLADLLGGRVSGDPDALAIAVAGHDGEAPVRLTYGELDSRINRLSRVLAERGVAAGTRVGVLLANGNEHLEAIFACFRLRAVPVNLNYRFVPDELDALIEHSRTEIVIHEPDLAPLLPGVPGLARGDEYERLVGAADPTPPDVLGRSGDDHYVLYTGGTTGTPKGVMWRHDDLLAAALTGGLGVGPRRCLVASPMIHGTGQWMALGTLLGGGTVVTTRQRGFDAAATVALAAEEHVAYVVIVGDAFALPLVAALRDAAPEASRGLGQLAAVVSGGASLSATARAGLLETLPTVMVVDGYGASETGGQARLVAVPGTDAEGVSLFRADEGTAILDDNLRPIPRGDSREGWLARTGPLPIGYDGDPEATARTFPEVDGVRWALPGDRARWHTDGRSLVILGRADLTINTGGEKVHPDEVEQVLRGHPAVADAIVIGTADDRWGEVVTAVVHSRAPQLTLEDLAGHCRRRLAPFKIPRRLVLVDQVRRSASGKPDYRWARALAD